MYCTLYMIKYNVFVLNDKNELMIVYDKYTNEWDILMYDFDNYVSIGKRICLLIDNYKIFANIENIINDNIICRSVYKEFLLKTMLIKMVKYYDVVEMTCYKKHYNMINYIYYDLRLTVVLDVDATLLESSFVSNVAINNPDHIVNNPKESLIWFRPHLIQFLDELVRFADIIYWTAATKEHQEPILRQCGLLKYSVDQYYREACISNDNKTIFFKDLRNIGVDLTKSILVDDNPDHAPHNPDNFVHIKSWEPNIVKKNNYNANLDEFWNDTELMRIMKLIKLKTDSVMELSCKKIINNRSPFRHVYIT